MKEQLITLRIKKVDGKFNYTKKDKELIKEFKDNLKEGQSFELTLQSYNATGSKAQISKIHASIRQIAIETGSTFEEMKLAIKHKAGLLVGIEEKSFADCTKEELMLVIETIKEIEFNL